MKKTVAFSFLSAGISLVLAGCAAPAAGALDDEEDVGEASEAWGGDDPPTGSNHQYGRWILHPTTVGQYPLLAAAQLDQGNGVLPSVNFGHTHGYDVWENLIYCALGTDQSMRTASGAVFYGHFGLATTWVNSALTVTQQRWVTGCMLQRLNAYGHPVPILLEGRTWPITYSPTYDSQYPWDESTVWGNVFSAAGAAFYVCSDDGLGETCETGQDISTWLQERICDGVASCGLTYRGSCADPTVCTPVTTSLGTYPVCNGGGVSYNETVHVQLLTTDATCNPVH